MANALYDLGRQKFLDGFLSWERDEIKLILVDLNDYTQNLATDEFLSVIPGGAIVATSSDLAGKDSTNGVADANDVVLSSVTGDESEALVLYHDVPSASGTGDSLSAPDSEGLVTVDDAAGLFVAGHERGFLTVSGASNGANDGSFFIAEYVSSTQIKIYNPAGVSETSSFSWQTDSPLIAFIDTAAGLPVTPNGGKITIAWDSDANKIFKL